MKLQVWVAKRIVVESNDPIFATLAELHYKGEWGSQEQYDRAAEVMSKQLGIPNYGQTEPDVGAVPEHFFSISTEDGDIAIWEE
jgi:hypothetical protein